MPPPELQEERKEKKRQRSPSPLKTNQLFPQK
jgi:hypothetical protein